MVMEEDAADTDLHHEDTDHQEGEADMDRAEDIAEVRHHLVGMAEVEDMDLLRA
jgi:hypothetical protein